MMKIQYDGCDFYSRENNQLILKCGDWYEVDHIDKNIYYLIGIDNKIHTVKHESKEGYWDYFL